MFVSFIQKSIEIIKHELGLINSDLDRKKNRNKKYENSRKQISFVIGLKNRLFMRSR